MRKLLVLIFALSVSYALGQDITNHTIPVGRGPGGVGWGSIPNGTAGLPLVSNGPNADPSFQASANPVSCASLPGLTGDVSAIVGSCVTAYATPVPLNRGGFGVGLTASFGGIFWSNATSGQILSGITSSGMPLLSGATSTPSWAVISYPTSAISGGIPFFSSSTSMLTTAQMSQFQLITGGGAGAPPTPIGSLGTSTIVLHGNASGLPTWSKVDITSDITGILPVANGGTACSAASGTCLDNITGFASTNYLKRTGAGTYQFDSASTVLNNICNTQGDILFNNGGSWVCLATGAAGQLLSTGGAGANPSWVTASGTGTITNILAGNSITLSSGTSCSTTCTLGVTQGQIVGTATNDSASSGNVGEIITVSVAGASAIAITSGNNFNVTSFTLTAGDWDVAASPAFTGAAATQVAYVIAAVSTTSATIPSIDTGSNDRRVYNNATIYNVLASITANIIPTRVSTAASTSVFLVVQSGFSGGVTSAFGFMRARRVR